MDVAARHLILICALALLAGGCQSGPDPSIELLESELRWMEDQLYDMDRALTNNCRTLESCQRQNAALRQKLASAGTSASDGENSAASPRRERSTPTNGGRGAANGGAINAPPGVDMPEFDEEELDIPEVDLGPDGNYPEFTPDNDGSDTPNSAANDRINVTRIVLNGRLTSGYEADGRPGDAGLLLVVEPQNDMGQYVPLPGQVEIAVYDPTRPGSLAQVARWQLSEAEVLPLIKQTLIGRGIHLRMPWPNRPRGSRQLEVQVQYQPPNGAPLLATKAIHVASAPRHASLPQQPEATTPPMRRRGPLRFAPLPRPANHLTESLTVTPPAGPTPGRFAELPDRQGQTNYGTAVGHQEPTRFDPYAGSIHSANQTPVWQPTR